MKDTKKVFGGPMLRLVNLARRLKVQIVKETGRRRGGRIEAEIRF